ncbi:MAG: DNA repair protein RecN [Victivallales bacterium]|nr:DNA repair protein RecN [Victivallales bacterium]
MLESLYIRNLVLVPELHVEFDGGFNTVTGETGAGKSLILGALHLLTGGRATASSIRRGAKSCEVSGVVRLAGNYSALREELARKLEEYGLPPCEEDRLLLRRVITESGSRAFINGSPVTAAILKEFGDHLIDIHGPNDSHSLLLPAKQLRLLDLYGGLQTQVAKVAEGWAHLTETHRKLQELLSEGLAPEELALLAHQLKEIDQAHLTADEEETLLERHRLAANSARRCELAGQLAQGLSQSDQSMVEALVPWIRAAEELAELDPQNTSGFLNRLNLLSEECSSLASELEDYASRVELDEEALHEMDERIELIQKLKRRYGPTLQNVLETAERLRSRLQRASTRTAELARLREEESAAQKTYQVAAKTLSEARRKAADRLAPAIVEKLHKLGFLKAAFEVRLEAAKPGSTGSDACEFFFAPNQGESISALRHAASSGEVARVMLAIKTVLSEVDDLPILVFDEIDANIGGRTAGAVATELHAVGAHHQVFSITHLPLIAAAGNAQYLVEKHTEDDRTITTMHRIDDADRTAEIVRMLGSTMDDATAVAHATEMLNRTTN